MWQQLLPIKNLPYLPEKIYKKTADFSSDQTYKQLLSSSKRAQVCFLAWNDSDFSVASFDGGRGGTRGAQIYVWGIDKDNFNIYLEKFKVFIISVIWHANSMQSGESWYQKNYTTCDSPIITWMTDNILSFWQNAAYQIFILTFYGWVACDWQHSIFFTFLFNTLKWKTDQFPKFLQS